MNYLRVRVGAVTADDGTESTGPRRVANPAVEDDPPPVAAGPGDGSLPRTEAVKDEVVRRWDVVSPSATRIGRPDRPEDDVSETVRRLHEERHPAMQGHGARMHRLDKARITHAVCSTLGVTRWERDRALGIATELDLRPFGQRRAVTTVALVVVRHVVDQERRRRLGLDDEAHVASLTPAEMADRYERFDSLTADPTFRDLMTAEGLDVTAVNRLTKLLREQIDEQALEGAVLGRSPYRDPNLPAIRDDPPDVDDGGPPPRFDDGARRNGDRNRDR